MRFGTASSDAAAYATAELTYPEHGATRGPLPPGPMNLDRRDWIGTGPDHFAAAFEALRTWRMHRDAGLAVLSGSPTADPGAVVVMRIGPPVVGLIVPCRVVYAVDEPGRKGFAYGTLPGHPERGEEAFIVELDADGEVYLVIRAFARPATLIARLGGPLTRAIQRFVTGRYVTALRRLR